MPLEVLARAALCCLCLPGMGGAFSAPTSVVGMNTSEAEPTRRHPCLHHPPQVKFLTKPEEACDALRHLSEFGVTFDDGRHCTWDDLGPQHMIANESLLDEFWDAFRLHRGHGLDGGKGNQKDKFKVKRSVVFEVQPAVWHRSAERAYFSFISL